MSNQAVKWAEKRRGLLTLDTGRLVEVEGQRNEAGEPVWRWDSGAMSWSVGSREAPGWNFAITACADVAKVQRHPQGCVRCFEVSTHAPGCMVKENLERGCPPWLASYIMASAPPVVHGVNVYLVAATGLLVAAEIFVYPVRYGAPEPDDDDADDDAGWLGWVALGPEGPTIQPWAVGSGEVGG